MKTRNDRIIILPYMILLWLFVQNDWWAKSFEFNVT